MSQRQPLSIDSPIKINSILNQHTFPNLFKTNKSTKSDAFILNRFDREIQEIIEIKKSGKLHEALKRVNTMIESHPSQMRCYQIKGEIAFCLKQYEESLSCYNRLLQINDNTENGSISSLKSLKLEAENQLEILRLKGLYHFNRGLCLQKLERHSQAVLAFKEAINLNKYKVQIYISLAQSYKSIGKADKMMHIFEKLTEKSKLDIESFKKIIDFLMKIKEYQGVIKLISKVHSSSEVKATNNIVWIRILLAQASSMRKLERYQSSIEKYKVVLELSEDQQQSVHILFNLASCYQKSLNFKCSVECYERILKINGKSLQAMNNLANLYIRTEKYQQALSILNSGIATFQATKASGNKVKLLLLKSHRIIALMKLGRQFDSQKDLREVIEDIRGWNCLQMDNESEWQNYKFVKGVVGRYESSLSKLSELEKQVISKKTQDQCSMQIKEISKKLMNSISFQLEGKVAEPNDELEKLSQRINKLYSQIVEFKSKTLKEQEISQLRVHTKIQQIQSILQKKQEETNKLVTEMEELKRQYLDVYNFLKEIRINDKNNKLSKTIQGLRQNKKQLIASYVQELYWVFSAYIISIRLVANQLVSQGKDLVHSNGISSFFSRFKSVFETTSHIPHIGTICSAINSLLSLYLSQESRIIYNILNKIITKTFNNENELQLSLQNAIQSLICTDYIQKALEKFKKDKIRNQMSIYNRANDWFKKQKSKVIKKIMNLDEVTDTAQESMIKDLVIEDIGSILLFLIRNKHFAASKEQFFIHAFKKTLLQNFKDSQIKSLYEKHQEKEGDFGRSREGCSNKCQIY